MTQLFTAVILGLLTILDPCTLLTSITAIGYIDKEISNRRKVLGNGLMFVLGKLCTYLALSVPFYLGAKTEFLQHLLSNWGEPVLAAFMLICGILLLISGHHHHQHDHGLSRWINNSDGQASWLWSFLLGVFFAIAFCPHRLVYFITMIDLAITHPFGSFWLMPILYGLGTGLPIMLIAWIISYSAVSIGKMTDRMNHFEHWFRRISAILFIGFGMYLVAHIIVDKTSSSCECEHHHHEHPVLSL